jgi:hypothetical protein
LCCRGFALEVFDQSGNFFGDLCLGNAFVPGFLAGGFVSGLQNNCRRFVLSSFNLVFAGIDVPVCRRFACKPAAKNQ